MDIAKAQEIFDHFFLDLNGHLISVQGRDLHGLEEKSYVYGEVMPESFLEIIRSVHPRAGEVFYDFGSGTGKAVLLAELLFEFSACKGIEFVDTLYESSIKILQQYEAQYGASTMSFSQGSFLDADVSDADIIFMNSTCFEEPLMDAIDLKLQILKPGSRIISLSKSLKSPSYNLDNYKKYEFSWGDATVYFHSKL